MTGVIQAYSLWRLMNQRAWGLALSALIPLWGTLASQDTSRTLAGTPRVGPLVRCSVPHAPDTSTLRRIRTVVGGTEVSLLMLEGLEEHRYKSSRRFATPSNADSGVRIAVEDWRSAVDRSVWLHLMIRPGALGRVVPSEEDRDLTECEGSVDGRAARLTTYRLREGADTDYVLTGEVELGADAIFGLDATAVSPAVRDKFIAAFWSLRFRGK